MAKKAKTVFVCQECGYESAKWLGQCPVCSAWNSFVEEKLPEEKPGAKHSFGQPAKAVAIKNVSSASRERIDTGIRELNRVLGGGLVKGSLTLICGEPGIGKSTIILQAASNIAASGKVLYVSGEESEEQIKMRAERICKDLPETLYVLAETDLNAALSASEEIKPDFLIIDSIQTMYSPDFESAAGSVSQVRACANSLMAYAKGVGVPTFIVAHVTKSGELAGPKIVEHMVDTVLQFNGERNQDLRILRSLKNRFGTTSEIGAFEMREEGLVEIENLSESFLSGLSTTEGAVAAAVYEGTRPLLLEIQALTSPCNIGFARRTAVGIDNQRLGMIIAVLERKAGVSLINRDVYVNVVGGLRPEGTSHDLAAALAIWSAEKNRPISAGTLVIGEIGLTGELRPVQNAEKLLKEASRMGFSRAIVPKRNADRLLERPGGMEILAVSSLKEAIENA